MNIGMKLGQRIKPNILMIEEIMFDKYPEPVKSRLIELCSLILEVALSIDEVGELEETLKWGQPSYLPSKTKSGTSIRIDADTRFGLDYALYVNCKTNLVENWRELYPALKYGSNRSVHFSVDDELEKEKIKHMIAMALTYFLNRGAKNKL